MHRASTLDNNSLNVVLLNYLWRTTAVHGHSKSMFNRQIAQWSHTGWLSTEDTSESFDCDRFLAEWWLFRHDDLMMYSVCFCQVLVWLKTVYLSSCYPMNLAILPYIARLYAERSSLEESCFTYVMTEKYHLWLPYLPFRFILSQHDLECSTDWHVYPYQSTGCKA